MIIFFSIFHSTTNCVPIYMVLCKNNEDCRDHPSCREPGDVGICMQLPELEPGLGNCACYVKITVYNVSGL
ncbi:hypothetical protein P8452_50615 [Trifolium repens]|nr:hypothetical protein P8452_50615 [Trifolium repens]